MQRVETEVIEETRVGFHTPELVGEYRPYGIPNDDGGILSFAYANDVPVDSQVNA